MNLAQGLERRLEKIADGASASVFRGTMHPITIATRLVRQLEFLARDTPAGTQVPNDLVVSINPSDLDPSISIDALSRELEYAVTHTAAERGWRHIGDITVRLRTDAGTPRGIVECTGEETPTPLEPWAQLIADDGSAVLPISYNRTLVGRELDCDVRVANPEVSRYHAIVFRENDSAYIKDLGSSNGTFVNGRAATTEPLPLIAGDNILLGDLSFTYRVIN